MNEIKSAFPNGRQPIRTFPADYNFYAAYTGNRIVGRLCTAVHVRFFFQICNGFCSQFVQRILFFQGSSDFSPGCHFIEIHCIHLDLMFLDPYCGILLK